MFNQTLRFLTRLKGAAQTVSEAEIVATVESDLWGAVRDDMRTHQAA